MVGFMVADITAEVRDLRQRGVQFENYDFPGFDKATGIADVGGTRAALTLIRPDSQRVASCPSQEIGGFAH
jgi:hypothetical protein